MPVESYDFLHSLTEFVPLVLSGRGLSLRPRARARGVRTEVGVLQDKVEWLLEQAREEGYEVGEAQIVAVAADSVREIVTEMIAEYQEREMEEGAEALRDLLGRI